MNALRVELMAVVLVVVGFFCLPVAAQVGAGAEGAIAYSGYLEKDGDPINGSSDFRFRLFDAAIDGNQIGSDFLIDDAPIYSGRFSVALAPFPKEAFSQNPIYLEITIIDATGEVTMNGRQQILPVPFALGTTQGNDLSASGDLAVAGAIAVAGGVPDATVSALVIGDGANGQSPDANGTLVPESLIEFPIGDEAAGGMSFYDVQNADQQAEISYDSFAPELRILHQGSGLHLDGGGNVTVDGTVRFRCPTNMTRMGTYCIDKAVQSSKTWTDASLACHDRYAMICSFDVLMLCDALNSTDSACGNETDSVANTSSIWTSQTSFDTFGSDSIWSEVAAYNGEDNSADRTPSSASKKYFCCIPGYFFGDPID